MAFTPYLAADEYADYGIAGASTAQVNAACRLIDTFLGRPEGLLWSPGANGMPAYQTNKQPTASFVVPDQILPGETVAVVVPNASFGPPAIGEVAILSRTSTGIAESCVVIAASGNTLTLDSVQFTHPAQTTLEFGLTIIEERQIRKGPFTARASRSPLVSVLSAFCRNNYGSLPTQISDFGSGWTGPGPVLCGQPKWSQLDQTEFDINYNTGVISVLPGLSQSGNLDIRLHYLAGWSLATLPEAIKQAVATIVGGQLAAPDMAGNIQTLKAGDATITRFKPGSIDQDAMSLLAPFRTLRMA